MAANTNAIFPLSGNITMGGSQPLSAALTGAALHEGTTAVGTAIGLFHTAGANGSVVHWIRFKLGVTSGLTGSGTTAATVARVWINNGGTNTVATNNSLYDEITLPATALSNVAKTQEYDLDFKGIKLPAGYKIYIGLATAAGGTNLAWIPTVIGQDL